MKLVTMLVCSILFSVSTMVCDPLLVVVLMVKNEQAAIEATLLPFAQAGIDSYLILDTGSTDNTIAVTQQFFATHGIRHGYIEQQPFVNFATSRNYALECAEKRFPHADFLLMIDAEWYTQNVQELLQFCAANKHDNEKCYLMRLVMEEKLEFYTARLIRPGRGARFEGVVHEVINHIPRKRVPASACFNVHATVSSRQKTEKRWLRDRDLLLQEYKKNPHDNRTVFYLAQTYECLEDWENACIYYTQRCAMQLGGEEDFMARYKLAQTYHARNMWPEALHHYLQAYSVRPSRAESLIRIAQYYIAQEQYTLAFLFARTACEIPYPADDLLFVEKVHYDYLRYDLLGHCAWHVGEYAIGMSAVRKALLHWPDAQHLINNVRLYAERLPNQYKPRVSIITSLFDGDEFIEGFLRDIVQQTIFNECELIIVNAHSPGNEEPIIRKYQQQYPNIIYIKLSTDPGIYEVWNLAISLASADFVTNANIDDRRNPASLEIEETMLKYNPAIDLVYGDYVITHTPNMQFSQSSGCTIERIANFSSRNMGYCLPGPQPMWRKSMHSKYGWFSSHFSSYGDYEFWCRAVSKGSCFKKIPQFISGVFYDNPQGLSRKIEIKNERDTAMQNVIRMYGYLWQ